jgi:cell division protein FtsL
MIKKYFLPYLMVLTIPLFLGLLVWQSHRYQDLTKELTRLEQAQREWVESNKRLIAEISEFSSPERISYLARYRLDLRRIQPESLLHVRIMGGEHGH